MFAENIRWRRVEVYPLKSMFSFWLCEGETNYNPFGNTFNMLQNEEHIVSLKWNL